MQKLKGTSFVKKMFYEKARKRGASEASEVPVITPKLIGGYRLHSKDKKNVPIYFPAINQIWISATTTSHDLTLALAHECMHVYTISLQPAQLLPLRAELLGFIDRPEPKHFDDVVETVCEAYFWAKTGLKLEDIPAMTEDAKYPDLFYKLTKLAKKIAKNVPEEFTEETATKEAVAGLCLLLMHIVPHYPKIGQTLVNIISQLDVPNNWHNRWQLMYSLYAQLETGWEQKSELQKQFTLVLPMDPHRGISDMILFLSAALKVVHYKPKVITAIFPVLLLLLTQASFTLLPIIQVKKIGKKYTAVIKLIHTTRRSKDPEQVAHMQKRVYLAARKEGLLCCAAPIFISLINESKRFRFSTSQKRISKCCEYMLEMVPNLLRKHILEKEFNCPGCAQIFKGEIFSSSLETIINMSDKTRIAMVNAANLYNDFLMIDTMNIIKDTWHLRPKPIAVRSYRYL